jgi:hypothetical protein
MKLKIPAFLLLPVLGLIIWTACNKPTPFGSELLTNQFDDYAFTDTMTVWCTQLREDSVVSSDRSSIAGYFLCGELNDPVFGKSASEIYALIRQNYLSQPFNSNQTKPTLDSIVLYLELAPAGVYGDTTTTQSLHVYQLDNTLDVTKGYYNFESIPATTEIGHLDYTPRPNKMDSLFSTTTKASFLRIPLSADFGNKLLRMDSLSTVTDTDFYKNIHGIKITTTTNGSSPGAMMAFNLNDVNFSLVRLYYKSDTSKLSFDYYFSGTNKFTHFTHDYSGSQASTQTNQRCDNLMYVQGMVGFKLKVQFPYATNFKRVAINEAKLVLTAINVPGDKASLTPAGQLAFTEVQGDSIFVLNNDVLYSVGTNLTSGFTDFGGFPVSETVGGTTLQRYYLTLNNKMQRMVNDTTTIHATDPLKNRTVYLNVYTQNRSAMRAILGGPKNVAFPAKLRLKYTRIK